MRDFFKVPFGWEHGLVTNNVSQQGPEFDLQNSKAGRSGVYLSSSAGEAEIGSSLGFSGQPASLLGEF